VSVSCPEGVSDKYAYQRVYEALLNRRAITAGSLKVIRRQTKALRSTPIRRILEVTVVPETKQTGNPQNR
jgi:hypothetical protein